MNAPGIALPQGLSRGHSEETIDADIIKHRDEIRSHRARKAREDLCSLNCVSLASARADHAASFQDRIPHLLPAGCHADDNDIGIVVYVVERCRSEEHTSELQSLMRI